MKVYKALDTYDCIKNIIVCIIAVPAAVGMIISISMLFTDPEASETIQTVLGVVRFVFTSVLSLIIMLVLYLLAQQIFKLIASKDGEAYHIDGLRRFEVGKQIIGGVIGIYVWGLFAFYGSLAVFPEIMPGNITNTEDQLATMRVIGIIFMLIAVGASVATVIKTIKNIKSARNFYDYANYKERLRKADERDEELQNTIQTIKGNITNPDEQAPASIEGGEDTDNPFI